MPTHKASFPKNSRVVPAAGTISRTPTFGKVFPNGTTIDLIKLGGTECLQLHLFDGKAATIAPEIEIGRQLFCPGVLSPSIQQIVRFPGKSADFGSTATLFAETRQLFVSNGFSADAGAVGTYLAFASWFADVSPVAPCLLVTGPPLEVDLYFRILSWIVRRPLPVSEFSRRAVASLPMQLQPTLLIKSGTMAKASRELLRLSNQTDSYIGVKDGLVDVYCAKAVNCGLFADTFALDENALHLDIAPFNGRLPILDRESGDELSRELQAKFLAYRSRHILDVRHSQFDHVGLTSLTRILARILGAPLVDAPEAQADLIRLLQKHDDQRKAFQWTNLRSVVLEAVIKHTHAQPGTRVYTGEIADTAMHILEGRGDPTEHDPREVGPILRSFGLHPEPRRAQGFPILLDATACRSVHRLASGLGLQFTQEGNNRCRYCDEIADSNRLNEELKGG